MRVALPVFGEDVAPRFCFARELLVVDLDDDQHETGRRFVLFGPEQWGERIRLLHDLGVEVLLCGGFNRRLQPMADQAGIRVLWGQRGEAETILAAFREGKIDPPAQLQQGRARGRGRGRRRASGGRGQGRCR